MGRKIIDLTGKKFNRLTVLKMVEDRNGHTQISWVCKCLCGIIVIVRGGHLRGGHTQSCGCLKAETFNCFKHGKCNTREYKSWDSMKQRCLNPNDDNYKYYGVRGIKICDRWKDSFKNFLEDLGERPDGHTLDRINNEGNYEPKNCRWSNPSQQTRNQRPAVLIEYNGIKMIPKDWAMKIGISRITLRKYLKRGESIGEIMYRFSNNNRRR